MSVAKNGVYIVEKNIYINQSNKIISPFNSSADVIWEIDYYDNLKIEVTAKGITIDPNEDAISNPERILGCGIKGINEHNEDEGYEEYEEIKLIIKKKECKKDVSADIEQINFNDQEKPHRKKILNEQNKFDDKHEQTKSDDKQLRKNFQSEKIPEHLKVFPDKNIPIPGTSEMVENVSWFFSDESLNSYLTLSNEGVNINKLPAGLYTLYYQLQDGKQKEIVIQSVQQQVNRPEEKKKQQIVAKPELVPKQTKSTESILKQNSVDLKNESSQKQNELDSKLKLSVTKHLIDEPEQPPEPKQSKSDQNNWPKISGKCAVEVSRYGQNFEIVPIKMTSSILIGKKSRNQKVVDIDLSQYAQTTDKISKNHLKLWLNGEHLMMKNIGSHRVLYCEKEMFPDQLAVLKIGGEINIGDITLTIIKA